MPAPHRLSSLYAARPDEARAELRELLTEHRGSVPDTARALGLSTLKGPKTVHLWITAWELREWFSKAWPAAQRISQGRKAARKDRPDP